MTIEQLLADLEQDSSTQNFIAQADARYILLSVNEPLENFPRFRENLDEGLDTIAYSYLAIGCSFAENSETRHMSYKALEKAATILEHNHLSVRNRNTYSRYHILISGLAYYASCHYSKSFVLLSQAQYDTPISKITYFILTKKIEPLLEAIDGILLPDDYIEASDDKEAHIYNYLFAKSILLIVRYLHYGENKYLHQSVEIIDDLLRLAIIDEDPAFWWVIRLLRIIVNNFTDNSLWATITADTLHCDSILPSTTESIRKFISGLVFRDNKPVFELFQSQIAALGKVFEGQGAVISLPTSSGKTRIAELSILNSLIQNPYSKVLYLAPFRSLAYELETSLYQTFRPLGYTVSHLYGGSQYSNIDRMLIGESQILISTPEKAKAILRANVELAKEISLIIMDEGHLLDSSQRYVQNEIFTEELRCIVQHNGGKIILLSAVLPNSEELSQWIANDSNRAIKSSWRPSSQRFGIINHMGANADIEWRGREKSYNNNFLTTQFNQRGNVSFPKDKQGSVCGVAAKLSQTGSVLIFVGRPNMVEGYAKRMNFALEQLDENNFRWKNQADLERLELICSEIEGENSTIIAYARRGIICHHGKLNNEVRLALERLMRNGNPKVVIATTTLAQGVNIGVSSVIFANVWVSNRHRISKKDFWNITGRAGRAFVDTEGKILFALDNTQEKWKIDRDKRLIDDYFNPDQLERAHSGILEWLTNIIKTAEDSGVDFEHLLELISENDFTLLGEDASLSTLNFFDWIDDAILSLTTLAELYHLNDQTWLESFYRSSLAYIQCDDEQSSEKIIRIMIARSYAVKQMADGCDSNNALITSGIPLMSAVEIMNHITDYVSLASSFLESEQSVEDKIVLLKEIEREIHSLPSEHFAQNFEGVNVEQLRSSWLRGENCRDNNDVCTSYYGYTVPWALNAIAKILKTRELEDESLVYEELALITELGLPDKLSVKIYLAGIKSRSVSVEIRRKADEYIDADMSIYELTQAIIVSNEALVNYSELALRWIEVLKKEVGDSSKDYRYLQPFHISTGDMAFSSDKLICRKYNDYFYLCDIDFQNTHKLPSKLNDKMEPISNSNGLFFRCQQHSNWELKSVNPYIKIEDDNVDFH